MATVVIAAVSALKTRAPRDTETKPAPLAASISSLEKPPSGPTIPTKFAA